MLYKITGRLFILIINKDTLTSVRLIQGLVQTTWIWQSSFIKSILCQAWTLILCVILDHITQRTESSNKTEKQRRTEQLHGTIRQQFTVLQLRPEVRIHHSFWTARVTPEGPVVESWLQQKPFNWGSCRHREILNR